MSKSFRVPRKLSWLTFATAAMVLTVAAARASEHAAGLAPQEAFAKLCEGNLRFSKGQSTTPDLSAARLHELTAGQTPYAVVITCSDSRVPPEHIFNAGLGELFVIRVAGNVADSDVIASTEYAVEHLGTRLVVVLGHESCGAVKAAVAGAKDSPAIEGLVAQIAPSVAIARDEGLTDQLLLDRAIVVNANKAREKLINQSALLKEMVLKGELKVLAGKYELATGRAKWLNLDGLAQIESAAHLAKAEAPVPAEHGSADAGAKSPTTQPQAAVPTVHRDEP